MSDQPKIHPSDASDAYLEYFDRDIDYTVRTPPEPYELVQFENMVWEIQRGQKRFARIQSDENVAKRIIDCLNACRGIPTEAFQDGGVTPLINACKAAVRVFKEVLAEKYRKSGQTRGVASANDMVVWRELQEQTYQITGGKDVLNK